MARQLIEYEQVSQQVVAACFEKIGGTPVFICLDTYDKINYHLINHGHSI